MTVLPLLMMFLGWSVIKRLQKGIWVTGIDTKAGTVERRRFATTNAEGGLTWKKKHGDHVHLVLGDDFRYGGIKGPEFLADISTEEGRLVRIGPSGDALAMPGQRMWAALFGQALRQISDSARANYESLLKMAIVGALVALVIIGGLLIYVIKLLNDTGVVG